MLVQHFHSFIWHGFVIQRARRLFCPVRQALTSVFITEERFSKEPVSIATPQLSASEQADLLVV